MPQFYRQGVIGALLDEYERAVADLKKVISPFPDAALTIILDKDTSDENCRSLQTILSHVVSSGYSYAISIHNSKGSPIAHPVDIFHTTIQAYLQDLTHIISYTANIFTAFSDHELENKLESEAGRGQVYDIEQMTEHAIVHVLRHRRQIERLTRGNGILQL